MRASTEVKRLFFLYLDGGQDSKQAEDFLRSNGIPIHVIDGGLDDGWNYPLLQILTSSYPQECEGLDEIRGSLSTIRRFLPRPKVHDHSEVLRGRSRQTDRYPDGCLVLPWPKLQ